jgi:hypothetical protein
MTNDPAVIVELLYHIAAVIACRAGMKGSKSYNRREAAANDIELILGSNPAAHKSPLPIPSYAASLSMTVAYRELRDNQSTDSTSDPIRTLTSRCEILESFKERWWSAEAMARLGRKALRNIQDLSKMQHHCQKSGRIAARPNQEADVLNPLEMLSSVAETHAHGTLSTDVLQASETAAKRENNVSKGIQALDANHDESPDSAVATEANGEFDPFLDLDTAFEDFFNLSMPTTFFDPLFGDVEAFDFANLPE